MNVVKLILFLWPHMPNLTVFLGLNAPVELAYTTLVLGFLFCRFSTATLDWHQVLSLVAFIEHHGPLV